jgi:hypothetical protein
MAEAQRRQCSAKSRRTADEESGDPQDYLNASVAAKRAADVQASLRRVGVSTPLAWTLRPGFTPGARPAVA